MNNQHEIHEKVFVMCKFISSRKLLESFNMEVCIDWTNREIEKAIKFLYTECEENYLKMESIQFIIFGKLLEDDVTLQDHLEKYQQDLIDDKYQELIEQQNLEIFINFTPMNSVEFQKKKKQINSQKLKIMVETITQIQLDCYKESFNFYKEFANLFDNINFDLLDRKEHGYYFLVQNFVQNQCFKLSGKNVFIKRKQTLAKNIMQREQYFRQRIKKQKEDQDEFQIGQFMKSAVNFLYKKRMLLFLLILSIFFIMYFYNYVLLTIILISFINNYTEFYFDLANSVEIRKQYFEQKSVKKKVKLIVLETAINFFLSIGVNFNYQKTKGRFQNFLKNFENDSEQQQQKIIEQNTIEQQQQQIIEQNSIEQQHDNSEQNLEENSNGDSLSEITLKSSTINQNQREYNISSDKYIAYQKSTTTNQTQKTEIDQQNENNILSDEQIRQYILNLQEENSNDHEQQIKQQFK